MGVTTSLVSIFTSKELLNMSASDDTDDELIDNSNNIIKTLQAHENAINRNEATLNETRAQIHNLEKTISLEKKTTDAYIRLFAIKLFGSTSTQHLSRIHQGLFQLLKNKISSKLILLSELQAIT